MAYVTIPKDLSKVKNKVFLNLTKRQLVCMGFRGRHWCSVLFSHARYAGNQQCSGRHGAPDAAGVFLALYEKTGMHLETILTNFISVRFKRPAVRRYEVENLYERELETAAPIQKKGGILGKKLNRRRNRSRAASSRSSFGNPKGTKRNSGSPCSVPFHIWKWGATVSAGWRNICIPKPSDSTTLTTSWHRTRIKTPSLKAGAISSTISMPVSVFSFRSSTTRAICSEYNKVIQIEPQHDQFDDVRMEYAQMLKQQLAKGNNGLVRTKYITFSIEAKSVREAKPRLERIETDILNNFKVLGVKAYPLNGVERLQIMYETFHQEEQQKFDFSYDRILQSGMTTKDFIAPTSFLFKSGKDFMMGDTYGAASYLNILAPELTDKILAEFLDMDKNSGGQYSCAVGRPAESHQTDQRQNYRPGSYENRGTEESCEVWL